MSNVNVTPGSGVIVSTDTVTADISNVQNVQPAKVVGGVLTRTPLPVLGTAGTPSADVVSVQGVASGTPVPVSGTITTTPPADASTNITKVGGAAIAEGQAAMAASLPVAIASDQSAVPVSAASLPLPAGAAADATVSAMSAKLPASLGQKAMAASLPVVLASDQSAVPVSAASLPLPAGASQDGTDPVGTNAGTQAGSTTPGVGIRGWLSTLVGIFQSVGGKVQGLGTPGTPAGGVLTVQPPSQGAGYPTAAVGADGLANTLNSFVSTNNLSAYPLTVVEYLFTGSVFNRKRTPSTFKAIAAQAVTAGTPVSVWTPASGKSFRFMGGGLSLSVAGAIIFKDGTTGAGATVIWQTPSLLAGAPYNIPENFANGIFSAAANNQLWIDVTASGTVNGGVFGTEE